MSAMHIAPYRIHDAGVSPDALMSDLRAHPVSQLVLRQGRGKDVDWYAFDVDDELLRKLKRRGRLHDVLGLEELRAAHTAVIPHTLSPAAAATRLPHSPRPIVLLDAAGNVGGVAVSRAATSGVASFAGAESVALPAAPARLFPQVASPRGNETAPGETLDYVVTITTEQAPGAPAMAVTFPAGMETLELYGEIASKEFAVLPGTPCFQKFIVDRQLQVTPKTWEFTVSAVGDRPCYSLDLIFHCAGSVVGRMVLTAARRGVSPPIPAHTSSEPLTLPTRPGAGLVLFIAERAGGVTSHFDFVVFRNGTRILEQSRDAPTNDYFDMLEEARDLATLKGLGTLLRSELPDEVVELLDAHASSREPILIMSNGRVAPFELMQLCPAQDGPFLGVAQPLGRWIYERTPPDEAIRVCQAACLRPSYQGIDELKDAVGEESDLAAHIPLIHAGTRDEFDSKILNNPDIGLLHFAGHAQAAPALLKLEAGGTLEPAAFHPKFPLMCQGRPFVFLNGCEIGKGTGMVPAPVGNLVKTLIKHGCRAVVAPFVKVQTAAARTAAEIFYDAAATEPIGEAVRRVREEVWKSGTRDDQRATFLSYAAFAMPATRLVWS